MNQEGHSWSDADLAARVINSVPNATGRLASLLPMISDRAQEVRRHIADYPFNRYTNWGLNRGERADEASSNYFLAAYNAEECAEFERRLRAINVNLLQEKLNKTCRLRYGIEPISAYVFGGYIYGTVPVPDDLDVLVLLPDSQVIEKNVVVEWPELRGAIQHPRPPRDKIGLSAMGQHQINAATQNNSVLRSALIANTTAIRLYGPPLQSETVSIAVLLYHAIELVVWGFKLFFEQDAAAHERALSRLVEADYILRFIRSALSFENGTASVQRKQKKNRGEEMFTAYIAEAQQVRDDAVALKEMLRVAGLSRLQELVQHVA